MSKKCIHHKSNWDLKFSSPILRTGPNCGNLRPWFDLVAFLDLPKSSFCWYYYFQVALHYWGTETGAVPVVSFLFLRDCCIRLGSDCLDDCIRGMYKAFVLNCNQIKPAKLQHIQFLSNCFTVLLGVDTSYAYQHAFVYIRQLAMILKEELSCSTKDKKTKKGKDEPSNSRKEKRNAEPSSSKKKVWC